MVLIISSDVQNTIDDYSDSLTHYPISAERAHAKIENMMGALRSLCEMPYSNPVCNKKCLGQTFENGQPVFINLRYFSYADESKFQWSFSYLIEEESDTVTVVHMMPSSNVINEKIDTVISHLIREYLSSRVPLMESARATVRMNESELKEMIRHIVKRVINEEYKPIGSRKFKTKNGKIEWESVITLQSDSGQVCHIANDDHCYVLFNGDNLSDNDCEHIHYIFPEAVRALQALPLPS